MQMLPTQAVLFRESHEIVETTMVLSLNKPRDYLPKFLKLYGFSMMFRLLLRTDRSMILMIARAEAKRIGGAVGPLVARSGCA